MDTGISGIAAALAIATIFVLARLAIVLAQTDLARRRSPLVLSTAIAALDGVRLRVIGGNAPEPLGAGIIFTDCPLAAVADWTNSSTFSHCVFSLVGRCSIYYRAPTMSTVILMPIQKTHILQSLA